MPSVARKGDFHACPLHGMGTIIEGSPTTIVEGKPVARVGDLIACADGSIAVILPNNACVSVDGKRIARKGDFTSHGGVIVSGADSVTVANGDIQILMGKDIKPIEDGKFRFYINSPNINIYKNMHFGNTEKGANNSILKDILEGIGLEIAAIPLDEVGIGEAMQVAGTAKLIKIGTKIKKQIAKRGWSKEEIEKLLKNPYRKATTRDTRYTNPNNIKNDEPATAYIDEQGNYVVQNDNTGDIVQVSNKNDPDWKSNF